MHVCVCCVRVCVRACVCACMGPPEWLVRLFVNEIVGVQVTKRPYFMSYVHVPHAVYISNGRFNIYL